MFIQSILDTTYILSLSTIHLEYIGNKILKQFLNSNWEI